MRTAANPELADVYYTERFHLTAADQTLLRNVQRSTVDSWMQLRTAARSSVAPMQARFLVHAAIALVIDLGRMADRDDSAYAPACVRKLMELKMFGSADPGLEYGPPPVQTATDGGP